ncbi:MAG: polysaccharide pyruvyl transferase family protein, partial [Verrucomicrobiaceae bacterium]
MRPLGIVRMNVQEPLEGARIDQASSHYNPDGTPVLRIGLLWHSAASGNLGVGALTVANRAIAAQVARDAGFAPAFIVLGMREEGEPYLSPDQADIYSIDTKALISPNGFWSTIGALDCVLDIGAGDSFAEIYGLKRFGFLWLSKVLTLARRVPLLLSPQTIGPFSTAPYRSLARPVLERANLVVARDEMSLAALRDLAPAAEGRLSVDVAFALPYEDRSVSRGGEVPRIGLNVSGLLFNEAESGRNRFKLSYNYAAAMRGLLSQLSDDASVEVHLVTHACHLSDSWDDDGRVADRLAVEFPSVRRVPDFTSPSDAKSYISGLDFLVAARMHACIAAFSAGTPVVP